MIFLAGFFSLFLAHGQALLWEFVMTELLTQGKNEL
jgi:hypothetical protein